MAQDGPFNDDDKTVLRPTPGGGRPARNQPGHAGRAALTTFALDFQRLADHRSRWRRLKPAPCWLYRPVFFPGLPAAHDSQLSCR